MRIGCLGLSANPPHIGHIENARTLLASGRVDEVWLIPVFRHPFASDKPSMAQWHHRVLMARMLEEPGVIVSEVEGELGSTSYTLETLRHLNKTRPEHMFYWCVGSDIITSKSYLKWKCFREIEQKFRFFAIERPGYPLKGLYIPGCFEAVGLAPGSPISSTEIRTMIKEGKDIAQYVGENVADYIEKYGLYKK